MSDIKFNYDKSIVRKMVQGCAFLSNDEEVNAHVAGGFEWCLSEIEKAEAKVQELEKKLASFWHICNVYDGDFAGACDIVTQETQKYMEKYDEN